MWLYYFLLPLAWVVWHLAFRIRVYGRENLIWDRGFVLAPNHLSAIDPVFIAISRFWGRHLWGRQMWIFAKKELFEINGLISWFLRQGGGISVRGRKEDRATVDKTIEQCKNGRGLLIFPEGTREKEGKVLPLKSGAFVIASAAKVDMIPCRIIYDTPDKKMHLFCRVRICFGKPIPAQELRMGDKRDMARLRENKARLLQAWEELYQAHKF